MTTHNPVGPTLETARLILRPPIEADLEPWAAFMSDDEAAKFIGGVMTPAATWRAMATITGSWVLNGYSMFSVIERETGEWVGRLGPWAPFGWPGTEVGWGISRSRWGRGYAVEGAAASMDWAFDHLGWTHIIHVIAPENTNSQAVAKKLGSSNQGQTRMPAPYDIHAVDAWGQSRDDWKRNRARVLK
jgi:RimJ/RimL family protein N-acetyltransferase